MSDIKKVVLAYSGGLDTSVILKWLQDVYQCEIVTFTADLGQNEELEPAREKALKFGISSRKIFLSMTCARNSYVISCFPCSGQTRFTRASICWALRSPGR